MLMTSEPVAYGPASASREPRTGLVDIVGFWHVLRRRARLIAVVAIAVMALVAAYLLLATPRYAATAVLIVDPRQQRVLQSEAVLPGIGQDAAAVESQVEVVQSSTIANRVIASLNLAQDPEFTRSGLLGRLLNTVVDRPVAPEAKAQRVLDRFADNLRVTRRGLSYVLEVRFTSEDAAKAAKIANAVAETYVLDQTAAKNDASVQAAASLNDRLGDLRKRASDAERAVAAFKSANNIVDTGEGRTLIERQISELNQQLILARARTAEARARLDQVAKASVAQVGSGAIPEALLSPVIANLRGQYAEAARREADTLATYGPKHPAVSQMRAQITDVRSQIEREIARVTAGIRNEFDVAQSRERSLDKSLVDLKVQADRSSQASVTLRGLEREAQASRTLVEQALLRFKETSEQEGLQRPDARLLSPATAPLKASEPKVPLVLFGGLVGAMILGVGAAVLREAMSRGLRNPRDVEASLSLPVLGLVPLIDPAAVKRVRKRPGVAADGAPREAATPARIVARYAADQPLSPFGEAIRGIRLRLGDGGAGSRAIAVLSALPNEGKSTLAVNLAHSFAKSGVKTLLIDTDIRKPAVEAGLWGDKPGLAQLLADPRRAEAQPMVDATSGLHLLPVGKTGDVATLAEALGRPVFRTVLDRFKAQYDLVILDGPPLLPVVDGRYLLEACDLAVMAMEWGRTDPDSAAAALESIGPATAKIAGIVMTKVDAAASGLTGYGAPYGIAAAA